MRVSRALLIIAISLISIGQGTVSQAQASSLALPVDQQITYHCQWTQRVGPSTPWTGTMTIRVNAEGIINGTYRSTSARPDPFYGRMITVTGALQGQNIRLSFGISPAVTVRGELFSNGISGTTTFNGGRFEFLAARAQ
ncbi:MAG TPA: hypothetical protein VFF60_03115 [Candidatus Binatus sp.]|nr:hypothetical protein [Candidatus Binatus sp.]